MRDPNLDKIITDLKTKNFREGEAKGLVATIGEEIKSQLAPLFSGFSKEITSAVRDAFKNVKVEVPKSDAPQVNIPEFPQIPPFPEMKAPVVNVPAPIVNIPAPVVHVAPSEVNFPESMSLKPGDRPFPVIMMDQGGKPMQFPVQSMGASGGRADFFTILGIQNTILAVNSDPAGVAYSTSNPLPVTITSGASATSASNIVDSTGVAYTGSNPLPVTFAAAASQNVNVFDGQASTVTSHQDPSGDFRGLDITNLRTVNMVSSYNSTTATLAGNAAFTGLAEEIKDYAVVQVNVFADQVSATDGLSVQQSSDGTNWDITDTYTIPASTGKTFSFQVAARYFRVVYTNGATIQGAFRIQVVLHQTVSKNSSQRPSDGLSNENDFEQVSAYMAALNASGNWDRLHTGGFDSLGALRTTQATDSVGSVVVNSGTITAVTGITNSIAAALVDSAGVQYSGSNPLIVDSNDALGQGDAASAIRVVIAGNSDASMVVNSGTITTVTTVTSVTNSIAALIVDSGGVGYSGSNPVPVTLANTGSTQNINMVGGGNDSVFTYMARTTIPTAVADGADVRPKADKYGRQLTRPIQVRDLVATAYVSLTTGTEATLLAASAGKLYDLVWVLMSNQSTAAVQVDVRPVLAGNILMTFQVPANGTVGIAPPLPLPGGADTGNAWTVDMPDVTGTTVNITGQFSQEI